MSCCTSTDFRQKCMPTLLAAVLLLLRWVSTFNHRRRRRATAASNSIPDSGGNGNGTIHGTVTPAGRVESGGAASVEAGDD